MSDNDNLSKQVRKRIYDKLRQVPGTSTGRPHTVIKKQSLLNEVLKTNGNITQATKNMGISSTQLTEYFKDGNFKAKLDLVSDELASELFKVGYSKALAGSDRMIEFLLPALDVRFDSGVRRQKEATTGLMQSEIFKRLLDPASAQAAGNLPAIDGQAPTIPHLLTDNLSYQSLPNTDNSNAVPPPLAISIPDSPTKD